QTVSSWAAIEVAAAPQLRLGKRIEPRWRRRGLFLSRDRQGTASGGACCPTSRRGLAEAHLQLDGYARMRMTRIGLIVVAPLAWRTAANFRDHHPQRAPLATAGLSF